MGKKIIVFDICGTLFQSNTTFDFLDYYLLTNKKYQKYKKIFKTLLWRCFNKFLRNYFNLDLTRVIAITFLKGVSRNQLLECTEQFYDNCLLAKSNREVVQTLTNYCLRKDCRVILLSATIDVVAETIANKLNCAEFYSTQLEYSSKGVCLGNIQKDLLGKKKQVLKDLNINQVDLFYTDDITDVPVLEVTKNKKIIAYSKHIQQWQKLINEKQWEVDYINV